MQVMKPKSTDVQKMLFSRENTKLSKNKYTGGLFQYKWKPFFVEVLPKSSWEDFNALRTSLMHYGRTTADDNQ